MDRPIDDESVTLARQHFAVRHMRRLRELVASVARRVGLGKERGEDFELAVNEAISNVIKHGGGSGQLELIKDDDRALIAQISDWGPGMALRAPIALPPVAQHHGRGLYLMQQLCDRVEYRTGPDGTMVHLEMDLAR